MFVWVVGVLGVNFVLVGLLLVLLVGGVLVLWVLIELEFCIGSNLFGGVGIGFMIVVMWWVSGYLGFVYEYLEIFDLVYFVINIGCMELLIFIVLMVYMLDWFILFSDTFKVLMFGVVSVVGVVVGVFV